MLIVFLFRFLYSYGRIINKTLPVRRSTNPVFLIPFRLAHAEFLGNVKIFNLNYALKADFSSDVIAVKAWGCKGQPLAKLNPKRLKCTHNQSTVNYLGQFHGHVCKIQLDGSGQRVFTSGFLFDQCDKVFEQFQGLIGLNWTERSLGQQLFRMGKINRRQTAISIGSPGGHVLYGDMDFQFIDQEKPMTWSTYTSQQYCFNASSLSVGDEDPYIFLNKVYLDVAGNDMVFPKHFTDQVLQQMREQGVKGCQYISSVNSYRIACYNTSKFQLTKLPIIKIGFDLAIFVVQPHNYITSCKSNLISMQDCTFSITFNEGDDKTRLGLAFLKDRIIMIDHDTKRIGLANRI